MNLDSPSLPEALTAAQAAECLGVSVGVIREWTRKGLIPHRKLGARIIFPRRALIRWLENCEIAAQEALLAPALRLERAFRVGAA